VFKSSHLFACWRSCFFFCFTKETRVQGIQKSQEETQEDEEEEDEEEEKQLVENMLKQERKDLREFQEMFF
jgi:hypothetical protein